MNGSHRRNLIAASVVAAPIALMPIAKGAQLTYWTINFGKAENHALHQIIASFEKRQPDIKIILVQRGTDAEKAALRVAADSNEAPDIYFSWAGLGLGGAFVKAGLAAPMGRYYKQYNWDSRFISPALAFSTAYKGGQFGVPFTYRGEGLYYNKKLFHEAGITRAPTTYKQLLVDAKKLKEKGIPAITFGGTVNWDLMRLMDVLLETECGAKTHDQLMSMKVSWRQEPCVLKSFTQLHAWTANYLLKPFMGYGEQQAFNLFLAGRAAMILEGNWLVKQIKNNGRNESDYGLFPFPTGTKRLYGFAEYNYISSKSKHPNAAAEFLNYMTSTAVQQKYLESFGAPSVNKHVKYANGGNLDRAWRKIFRNSQGSFVNGDQAFPLAVTREYWRMIDGVATNKIVPRNAGVEMQNFISNYKK